MFNKDNVFITVNEEVSSIIQQYIIREIKKVLDKYKSIKTEEISSVEKLINSISNEELKEEFLNDWSMSVKLAKEIGENEVDDRIISMYQKVRLWIYVTGHADAPRREPNLSYSLSRRSSIRTRNIIGKMFSPY